MFDGYEASEFRSSNTFKSISEHNKVAKNFTEKFADRFPIFKMFFKKEKKGPRAKFRTRS